MAARATNALENKVSRAFGRFEIFLCQSGTIFKKRCLTCQPAKNAGEQFENFLEGETGRAGDVLQQIDNVW
jgi:hypothetical protein